jgi:hypothetical protein
MLMAEGDAVDGSSNRREGAMESVADEVTNDSEEQT